MCVRLPTYSRKLIDSDQPQPRRPLASQCRKAPMLMCHRRGTPPPAHAALTHLGGFIASSLPHIRRCPCAPFGRCDKHARRRSANADRWFPRVIAPHHFGRAGLLTAHGLGCPASRLEGQEPARITADLEPAMHPRSPRKPSASGPMTAFQRPPLAGALSAGKPNLKTGKPATPDAVAALYKRRLDQRPRARAARWPSAREYGST